MSLKNRSLQQFSFRTAVVTTTIAAALTGFAGSAGANPTDPVVQFTPTLTRVPGPNCAAIINAETVPQPRSGEFGVRVKITQTGESCGGYHLTVHWRNLDTGRSIGQAQRIEGTTAVGTPDNVIIGMGMGPGAGKVEAWIATYSEVYPRNVDLEHIAGRATFTLG
ncbi:hypothetical protein NDR87_31185 [Nocardia sp. CDC159]|uniref:Uncharacterized protein n=1 Tax=Nocardia pulmonis TaxID=2951408 RepID=A0A9X2J0M3_9NOCA|nr:MULTISPECIES: hypothetical protein [Nocardia]MCM6777984.1 hypothetical protein [Nocardia pulmonis]MCM6790845.1 hypothetical protein [Nocardia sp. CDC159]